MLGEKRGSEKMGQGQLGRLDLLFGSNNPVAREIKEMTGIPRGWEVKLAPCTLCIFFHPHWEG